MAQTPAAQASGSTPTLLLTSPSEELTGVAVNGSARRPAWVLLSCQFSTLAGGNNCEAAVRRSPEHGYQKAGNARLPIVAGRQWLASTH